MSGPLKSQRHERFAQELAKGKSQTQAYTDAGYEGDVTAASRLSRNVNVQARVAELKERAAARTEITVASLTERLLKIAAVAEGEEAAKAGAPMLSVARATLMDVAKLNGLIVDRTAHSVDLSNLSEDDLRSLEAILGKTADA